MIICLFDIDGTLLLSGGAGKEAMEEALSASFGAPQHSDGVPFSGRTDRAIARDLFALHGIASTEENWQLFSGSYLQCLPGCLKRRNGTVLPGISSLLDLLRVRPGVAVGLLTGNVREGARIKLGHYGLDHHFTFGGFGDEHEDRSDVAREAFAVVRQTFGPRISHDNIWVIGDTPHDVSCARAIGVRAVAVATGWHSLQELVDCSPDLVLPDLTDPGPLFDRWA